MAQLLEFDQPWKVWGVPVKPPPAGEQGSKGHAFKVPLGDALPAEVVEKHRTLDDMVNGKDQEIDVALLRLPTAHLASLVEALDSVASGAFHAAGGHAARHFHGQKKDQVLVHPPPTAILDHIWEATQRFRGGKTYGLDTGCCPACFEEVRRAVRAAAGCACTWLQSESLLGKSNSKVWREVVHCQNASWVLAMGSTRQDSTENCSQWKKSSHDQGITGHELWGQSRCRPPKVARTHEQNPDLGQQAQDQHAPAGPRAHDYVLVPAASYRTTNRCVCKFARDPKVTQSRATTPLGVDRTANANRAGLGKEEAQGAVPHKVGMSAATGSGEDAGVSMCGETTIHLRVAVNPGGSSCNFPHSFVPLPRLIPPLRCCRRAVPCVLQVRVFGALHKRKTADVQTRPFGAARGGGGIPS